jgi:hypothetical protein
VLQQARAAQRTPEQRRALRDRLRPRAKVERKIAELMRRHGLRQGRYLGVAKTAFQAVLTATLVDAKRLLSLAAADPARERALRQALTAGSRAICTRLWVLQQWFVSAPTLPTTIKSAAT